MAWYIDCLYKDCPHILPGARNRYGRAYRRDSRLSRSCNEALVFAALEAGPKHGYQLALEVEERGRGAFGFKHGTLYPILHRLEKEGLIEGEWSDEGPKGKRKRYRLTQRGKLYARAQRESWRFFIERFLEVIGEVER